MSNQIELIDLFRPFFSPKAIVIIGASRNAYTFNGIVVKNLLEAQYRGKIYIVHPATDQLMGIACDKTIDLLIQRIDASNIQNSNNGIGKLERPELAIIVTQHDLIPNIETLGKLHIHHILIETDIHVKLNPTHEQENLIKIKQLINQYKLQVLGPTMIGIIDYHSHFTSSIIPVRSHIINPNQKDKPAEGMSFYAQSGGLSGACGWWAPDQNPFITKVIHGGDLIGVSERDIVEYLFLDPATKVLILYLKEISNTLIESVRRYAQQKPVLFKFIGKDRTRINLLEETGAISVQNYIELFEFGKMFLWCPPPINNYVGIIGPSSGAINLIIGEMRLQTVHLAHLDEENRKSILTKVGGSTCNLGNPVDYWPPSEFVGNEVCKIYNNASNALLRDQHVGGLFLALEFFTEIEFNFTIFENIKKKFPNKPIIAVLIQAERDGAERVRKIATELQIPVFVDESERAVKAFAALLKYYKIKLE